MIRKYIKILENDLFRDPEYHSVFRDLFGEDLFTESVLRAAVARYQWNDPYYKRILDATKFKQITIVPGSQLYNSLPYRSKHMFTKYVNRGTRRLKRGVKNPYYEYKPVVLYGETIVKMDLRIALNFYKKDVEKNLELAKKENTPRMTRNIKYIRAKNVTKDIIEPLEKCIALDPFIRVSWKFLFLQNDNLEMKNDPDAYGNDYKGVIFKVEVTGTHPIQKKPLFKENDWNEQQDGTDYLKLTLDALDDFSRSNDKHSTLRHLRFDRKEAYDIIWKVLSAYGNRKTKKLDQ